MTRGRLIIEVQAGVIPHQPIAEHTRRWAITEATWEAINGDDAAAAREALDEWDKVHGWAREYAARLQNHRNLNWVSSTWLWL